jgi:hypothetical protein
MVMGAVYGPYRQRIVVDQGIEVYIADLADYETAIAASVHLRGTH